MLKKNDLSKLAKLLRLDEAAVVAAITSPEEVDFAIPELTVLSPEELTKRDENIKSISYKEGKGAAVEMMVKEYREKLDLKFEGKDPEKLIEAIQAKTLADAKVEPSKKIEELNNVIANLQNNVKTFESEKAQLVSQFEQVKTDTQLLSLFPANRLPLLKDNEYLSTLKGEYTFAIEDGKMVAKKGTEIVRDQTTQAPVDPKDVISSYFNERKWINEGEPGRQGRGGKGDHGKDGVFLKLSELQAKFESEGKSALGVEFQAAVQAARETNPNFDLNA